MVEDTLRDLFESLHDRLYRTARRRLTAEAARDVVSETFATLWRKELPDPDGPDEARQLVGLTFKILDGHVRNAMRSELARARLATSLQVESSRRAATTETSRLIDDLLDAVGAPDRQVLELYIDGFATAEIAAIMGCSSKAAGMRLVRARRALQMAAEEVMADDRG